MDINQRFEQIFALYRSKGDPAAMMQSIYQQNPNMNQFINQFNNMLGPKSRPEAYMQIARQQGMSEENLMVLAEMLGLNKQ